MRRFASPPKQLEPRHLPSRGASAPINLSGGSMRPARRRAAGFAIFLIMTLAPFGIYGTIASAFTESCPSGRRSTIGNRVGAKSVSRVQIPDSPPVNSKAGLSACFVFTPRGGVAEWLNAAVSKTVYPVTPGTRVRIPPPPPSLFDAASPSGSFFCIPRPVMCVNHRLKTR